MKAIISRIGKGMAWPIPGEDMNDLEWRFRYGVPSRTDNLVSASIIAAYRQMIGDPQTKRQWVIGEIRKLSKLRREG